jgi:hypothetical protein
MTAIGLEPIKARLGAKWEKLAGLVHALFEGAIKASLKPEDAFLSLGELSFVVMYRGVSVAEAQLRCAELARNICGRLFGEEGSEISIRNVVGQIDSGLLINHQNLARALDEALESNGTETIISTERSKAASAHAGSPKLELRFTQQPRTYFPASLDELSFAYRPIWDCAFDMIMTYLCQPVPRGDVAPSPGAGFCTLAGSDEDRARLDCAVLSHCVKRIEKSRQDRSRVLLAVPLHFSTLARPRLWGHFNKIYHSITPDMLRHLVFAIFSLDDAPNSRLVQELPKLSGVRHVFCALERGHPVGQRFAGTVVHAIGMEMPELTKRETEMTGYAKSMAFDIRAQSFETFLLGVQTTSAVLAAMAAGIRYLEGPAIHPVIADPRCAVPHGLEDIYGDRPRNGLVNITRI